MKNRIVLIMYLCMSGMCFDICAHIKTYFVFLAGGGGERLWPISRQKKPKQLLAVGSEKTLLEQAVERVQSIVQPQDEIWVVTLDRYVSLIESCLGNSVDHILAEPTARNTGPSILLACLEIYKHDPDAVVIFLPADAYIPSADYHTFACSLCMARDFVIESTGIALLGVQPKYPATGYGYIEYAQSLDSSLFPIHFFHEKPNRVNAEKYIKKDTMLWNIGTFCAPVKIFIDEFYTWAPEIYAGVIAYLNGQGAYEDVPSISVDYAVVEHSKRTWVLPMNIEWSDIGNLAVYLSIQQKYMNQDENFITVDACNNFIDVPDKFVALVGVHDLCVVQTDDVVLITKVDQAEKVRSIVQQLKDTQQFIYL